MTAFQDSKHHRNEPRLAEQKVLIVHDDRDVAMMAARVLNRAGHHAVCAFNEDQIREQLKTEDFDLVILDWSFNQRSVSKRILTEIIGPTGKETIYCSLEPGWAKSTENRSVMNFFENQAILDGVELKSERARFAAKSSSAPLSLSELYAPQDLFARRSYDRNSSGG